jgi:hypothetical protein
MRAALFSVFAFVGTALCQFPPKPEGITSLKSKVRPGASISYKEVSEFGEDVKSSILKRVG